MIDDPVAHAELQKTYVCLIGVASHINEATDHLETRRLVEATWLLQDRLCLDNEVRCDANAYTDGQSGG